MTRHIRIRVQPIFARGIGAYTLVGMVACASASLTPLPPRPPSRPTTAPAASLPVETRPLSSLSRAIDSLIDLPIFRTASWGLLVLGPSGDTIYARNAAKLMIPASNMKLITGAVALTQLGPTFRFRDSALALPLRDTVPRDFGPMYDTLALRAFTLGEALARTLKTSHNRMAEQLLYTLALERTGVISRDSGITVERRQLAAWGVPEDGYILHDGSGYDRANYLSAETITHVLTVMQRDTVFATWYEALSIAGTDGTLKNRMHATLAERNAHAKTGSLGAVRALSGYLTTAGGARLTFSILCNGYTTPPETTTGVMDRIVALLAALPTTS